MCSTSIPRNKARPCISNITTSTKQISFVSAVPWKRKRRPSLSSEVKLWKVIINNIILLSPRILIILTQTLTLFSRKSCDPHFWYALLRWTSMVQRYKRKKDGLEKFGVPAVGPTCQKNYCCRQLRYHFSVFLFLFV